MMMRAVRACEVVPSIDDGHRLRDVERIGLPGRCVVGRGCRIGSIGVPRRRIIMDRARRCGIHAIDVVQLTDGGPRAARRIGEDPLAVADALPHLARRQEWVRRRRLGGQGHGDAGIGHGVTDNLGIGKVPAGRALGRRALGRHQ